MNDDAGCLRKYAESRDENAFAEFVRRNVDFVYSAAYRQTVGDRSQAEDIVQKVFTAAAQKAASLGRHPLVAAWLYQTTRFTAIDARRSRRRRQERESAAVQMTESAVDPNAPVEWERVSPELDKIIASLGECDRAAVILRFFGGKSFADIGEQLHLSEGAARMRVERALEKLRARLSQRGITSSCAALSALLAENGVMAAPSGLGTASIAAALAAPATVGLTATLAALQIMTSAKITLGVASLVTLASIVAAVHEFRHAEAAEAALATETAAHSALPARKAAAANSRPGQPRGQGTSPAQSPQGGAPGAGGAGAGFAFVMDLLSNPGIQKQNEIMATLRLDGQYAALFKNLNLTPDQIDQFKHLMVEKLMVGFDSMAVAHQQGIDPGNNPGGFFQAVAAAEKTVDSQISTLLGPDGFGQFEQYQQTVPARNTSNLLTQALSYTSAPLTEAQASGVIQILTQYGTPPLPPGNPFSVLNGDLGVIKLNSEGLAQMQGILSPPQLQALQAKMQQQTQLLQVRERMGH